jgi:hypothetical protein
MVKVLGVNKDKVEVCYGGVTEDFRKKIIIGDSQKIINKYGVKTPYILANATLHPHKNLISLVKAFIQLASNTEIKHNLVLIGINGKAYESVNEAAKKSGLKDRIIFTNKWIEHSNMKHFNKLADLFVIPSLYEGFGLPTVEAMACGTPIIASKYSCTPEIVGNGGLVVDVKKPDVISKSMYMLLKNKKKLKVLSKNGIIRSKMFSWKNLAKFNIKIYEKEAKKI